MTNTINDSKAMSAKILFNLCADHLESALGDMEPFFNPLSARQKIKNAFSRKPINDLVIENCVVFLFGSIARGEPGRDVDLLIVFSDEAYWHLYREIGSHTKIDLNLASSSWMKSVSNDVEWGYCLSEAVIVFSSSETIENEWFNLVNMYMKTGALETRIHSHASDFKRLLDSAQNAINSGRQLLASYCSHEAMRSAGKSIIEKFGKRVFSHTTFVPEVFHCCQQAGISKNLIYTFLKGLTGESGQVDNISDNYTKLRRNISLILRSISDTRTNIYDISDNWVKRCSKIELATRSSAGDIFESSFYERNAQIWLPPFGAVLEAAGAAKLIIRRAVNSSKKDKIHISPRVDVSRNSRIFSSFLIDLSQIPQLNSIGGARWIQKKGSRLTIILNTGGCRTASCRFCSLPLYGRSFERVDPLKTVKHALSENRPDSVALYNDGSILNDFELSHKELFSICDDFSNFHIKDLWIDSLPRYVRLPLIRMVQERSNVEKLIVGLGMQVLGNNIAMKKLGRPDPDIFFDRAVDILHEAKASVRLYLMWGYSFLHGDFGKTLLRRSINWATRRKVEYISICPYVKPNIGTILEKNMLLCELRSILAEIDSGDTKISVADWVLPACGMEAAVHGCPTCEEALRSRSWHTGPFCTAIKKKSVTV